MCVCACVCLHVQIMPHSVCFWLHLATAFHSIALLSPRCVWENRLCLLGSGNPEKHVRVHSIRAAQNNAFREATYTHPHRASPLPVLHKPCCSSRLHSHTHTCTHKYSGYTATLSLPSSLYVPAWLCQHHLTGTWPCVTKVKTLDH